MGILGPFARSAVVVVLAVFGAVAAFATIAPSPDAQFLLSRTSSIEALPIPAEALLPSPASYIREERFQRGDTLAAFLLRLGVADGEIGPLARQRAFQGLRPGYNVAAEVSADGRLVALSFLTSLDTLVQVSREGEEFRSSEERAALYTQVAMKSTVVQTSLFAASDAAGIPDGVAMQLADIFGGDVDFHRDLRKAFLRAPLEFSRVSSGFGLRVHPIARSWRAHQGIDYAAPTGTRVRAVGDALVEHAGPRGGYGNTVILRHAGQYTTVYAHLSRIAVRRGAHVGQNDTIGFVGQTGWATGPHLHYEFRVAGQARNPMSIAMPAASPVPAAELAAFQANAAPLIARLELLANSNLALLE